MRKLLRADFSRLWKDKIFWLGTLFMFGLGIFAVCSKYSDIIRYNAHSFLDDVLLVYVLYVGFLSAIFCSLFLGTEYSDGTIRNKMVVGHLRTSIYLSNWLTSIVAAIIMAAVFLLSYCTLGSFLLEAPGTPPRRLLFYMLAGIFTVCAFVSMYSMLAMLITKKSSSAVICLLVFIGLLILAMTIKAKLDAPEFIPAYSMAKDGVEKLSPEPNPKYLQPAARKVYQFFLDLLPAGQGIQLVRLDVLHPFLIMLYSVMISIITTAAGIFNFKRKDIK